MDAHQSISDAMSTETDKRRFVLLTMIMTMLSCVSDRCHRNVTPRCNRSIERSDNRSSASTNGANAAAMTTHSWGQSSCEDNKSIADITTTNNKDTAQDEDRRTKTSRDRLVKGTQTDQQIHTHEQRKTGSGDSTSVAKFYASSQNVDFQYNNVGLGPK